MGALGARKTKSTHCQVCAPGPGYFIPGSPLRVSLTSCNLWNFEPTCELISWLSKAPGTHCTGAKLVASEPLEGCRFKLQHWFLLLSYIHINWYL